MVELQILSHLDSSFVLTKFLDSLFAKWNDILVENCKDEERIFTSWHWFASKFALIEFLYMRTTDLVILQFI